MEILAQSSADFALTYNFQGTHIMHRAVIFAIARFLALFIAILSIFIILIIITTMPYLNDVTKLELKRSLQYHVVGCCYHEQVTTTGGNAAYPAL